MSALGRKPTVDQISFTEVSSAGFVELQTESADLLENVGAIPFLDFKHFASRIFFPEVNEAGLYISLHV